MKLTVSVIECKNLIVGDIITNLADPYVICTINAPAQEISEEEKVLPSPSAVISTHKTLAEKEGGVIGSVNAYGGSFASLQHLNTLQNPLLSNTIENINNQSSPTTPRKKSLCITSSLHQSNQLAYYYTPSTNTTPTTPRRKPSINDLAKKRASTRTINSTNSGGGTSGSGNYSESVVVGQQLQQVQQNVDTDQKVSSSSSSDSNSNISISNQQDNLFVDYENKRPSEFRNRKIIAQKKTEIIYNSLNPIFTDERIVVDGIKDEQVVKNWIITLEVFDYDYMKYDDYLGSVEISFEKYQFQVLQPMVLTIPLEGVPHGEITIDINLGEESKVFGLELEKIMLRHREKLHGIGLPKCVHDMFVFLSDEQAISEEGIFRIPGKSDLISSIKKQYDKSEEREIKNYILEQEKAMLTDAEQKRSPAMVKITASLLKDFIRSMPIPLLTYQLYDEFVELKSDDKKILELVQKLPPLHQHLLYWLLGLVSLIESKSNLNKMTASSLASVIAINLLRKKDENKTTSSLESVRMETDRVIRCVELLINKYRTVLQPYFEKTYSFFK